MTRLTTLIAFFALLAAPAAGLAEGKKATSERGTADEAVAMVKKAVAAIKANGKEKTLAEISDPHGKYVDRDLYVTAYDLNGTCLAHGFNSKLVGKSMIDFKDVDGKPFVRERNEMAKTKDSFWIDFKYVNPLTKEIDPKTMYVEKVGDVLVCCGIYKK